MRYFQEYRHKFSDASGVAIDAGKKLLGYIANQKRLSGVDSMVQRISVQDEEGAVWIVEARFDKDIPSVRIFPPNSDSAVCELYVESGLLDLGPNIAGDASERFNRGLPQFSEDPATLYFGTGVECVEGQPGLNGAVRLQGQNVASDCLPSTGNGIASRLTDPIKKQAQALLPASCWSGLMQRYVQAVYGGKDLKYSGSTSGLTVQGLTFEVSAGWGLLNLEGTLLFVNIGDDGTAAIHPIVLKSSCYAAALSLWRAMPDDTDQEKANRNKVLTIVLSGAKPAPPSGTVSGLPTGNRHFTRRSAWQFDTLTPKAVAVLESGGEAVVHTVTFSIEEGVVVASTSSTAPEDVGAVEGMLHVNASNVFQPAIDESGFELEEAEVGDSFDFPVFAYFNADGIVETVNYTLVSGSVLELELPECVAETELTSIYGVPMLSTESNGRQILSLLKRVTVVEGYYGPGWGSVSTTHCIDDDGALKWSAGTKTFGVAGELEPVISVSEDPEDFSAAVGGKSIWEGIYCYSAYPQSSSFNDTFSGPCNAFIATTTDLSLEQSPGGSTHYGCAVTFSDGAWEVDNTDCNVRYVFSSTVSVTSSVETIFEAYPYDSFGFDGTAYAGAPSVASLVWGGASVVSERYELVAGKGFFYRVHTDGEPHAVSVSGTIVREYTRKTAWPTRPDLFCKTLGELAGLGWVADDYDTDTQSFTETLSTAASLMANTDKAVIGAIHINEDGHLLPLASMVSFGATRGVDRYVAEATWAAEFSAGGAVVIDDEANAPYSVLYEPEPGWEIDGPGRPEAVAVGLVIDAADSTLADTDFGDGVEPWPTAGIGTGYVDKFSRLSTRSILGAQVLPVLGAERGASINMDRQTITGGYSPVSTPSFVGWA